MTEPHYGATADDWAHLDLICGLSDDLLPVVSHPDAVISPTSTMKQKGKVPSRYNGRHEVAGFPNWTNHIASARELTVWCREPDYGICVQTRRARALDVDVSDYQLSQDIHNAITAYLARNLPMRWRNNSCKFLLMFELEGDYRKRILRVGEKDAIEFLAGGQQFIAAGTHPSGARYEWLPAEPELIKISPDLFEGLWAYLEAEFGVAPTIEAGGARRRGPNLDVPDRTLDYLHEHGLVIGGDNEKVHIACPWEHEHTTESNISATSYFPAGTKGYEQGHFQCLHAHCAHRIDGDFINTLGVYMDEVEDLGPLPVPVHRAKLKLTRNKAGAILADFGNIVQFLSRDDITGWSLARDMFRDEVMIKPFDDSSGWRALKDTDYGMLICQLTEQHGFRQIGQDAMRRAVWLVAERHCFDSGIIWGNSLIWDGVPRIDKFFHTYYAADDREYHDAVGAYMWTALAGRLLVPGVAADMVPVLVGKQGVGKSKGIAALVSSHELRDTIDLMARDADLARLMRGRLVLEIGELRGLHGRDMEAIKDFISRSDDSWVPKYQEFATKYKRRCLMIGTTNQREFLADHTGNRRWLPVQVRQAVIAFLNRDRDQLWAEGIARFNKNGVEWVKAEALGVDEHHQYRMSDTHEERIALWLETEDEVSNGKPAERAFTMLEVMRDALHLDARSGGKNIEMKVGSILREFGYEKVEKYIGGKVKKMWAKV